MASYAQNSPRDSSTYTHVVNFAAHYSVNQTFLDKKTVKNNIDNQDTFLAP
jgi:hypothetical protein